ncbi:basic amino acid ABC transporter substrate-binding protein [Metabacillus idriensis]|uniref:basic amino acid ABC transporter substrate-binding protein n=1 Tax=Metabacillus idriensis TaxID=324768 RepID=UPI00174D2A6E|nr:basic amino acid ABC transporter substrate-binding protein [Metabacillus idriensis]
MKNNCKLIFVLLFSFVLMLSGCGNSEKASTGAASEEKKVLKVGTDAAFAPFEYMDKDKIVGFDVDFLEAVMKEAGYKHELENIGWDPLFASVQGKQIDLAISGITINDDRKQSYDFSTPYFESTHMIVFKEGTDIKSAEDLKGKKIGVQNGTTGQSAAEKVVGANNNISKYETTAVAFMALENNDVEVVVTDNVVASEYVKNNPNSKVEAIEDKKSFESEFYGLMFPKDSKLKEEFDKAIKEVIESGKYAEIYEKWFGKEPSVETLLDAE